MIIPAGVLDMVAFVHVFVAVQVIPVVNPAPAVIHIVVIVITFVTKL